MTAPAAAAMRLGIEKPVESKASGMATLEPIDLARASPALTVVVPCYNERLNVAPMVAKLEIGRAHV